MALEIDPQKAITFVPMRRAYRKPRLQRCGLLRLLTRESAGRVPALLESDVAWSPAVDLETIKRRTTPDGRNSLERRMERRSRNCSATSWPRTPRRYRR